MRRRLLVYSPAVLAGVITLLVVIDPAVGFAYRSASLHVALETASALAAALAAFLVWGRLRLSRELADLLLLCGLLLLGGTNLVFGPLPGVVDAVDVRAFATWASLAGALLASATLAVASLVPSRRLGSLSRPLGGVLGLVVLSLAAIAMLAWTLGAEVSTGVPPGLSPSDSGRPLLVGHPAVLGGQLATTCLLLVASLGFMRRGERDRDELFSWFSAAAILGAFGRLNYFLFPSVYTHWVYAGDFFRLGFYVLLAVGAGREIHRYWSSLAENAVLDERRRIARDLHDGLAQELAFIVAETNGVAAAAAERALDDSRRAIAALTRPLDEPAGVALVQAVEEVAARVGVVVKSRVEEPADLPPAEREALIRVAREAVTNAARHGRARTVAIELRGGAGLRLSIVDDGDGFDPAGARGFGLVSMRERIEALGGTFLLRSHPGAGTTVEVVLP